MDQSQRPGCFTLIPPRGDVLPVLVDSPHSGRTYPEDFRFSCPFHELAQAEDNHLDHLLTNVPDFGFTYLQAEFPRSYIDVNRAADDIDTALLGGLEWPEPIQPTSRSAAGIGLVRRLVRPGIPVYDRALSVEEIAHRLDAYYTPYYIALNESLCRLHYDFGQVWHLNMHSMPASSARADDGHPVDFVLGDRMGTTCRRDFINELRDVLTGMGYRVALNDPYQGVEIIRRTGNPAAGFYTVQIEINKALYWNEQEMRFNHQRPQLEHDLQRLFTFITDFVQKNLVLRAAD